MLLRVPLTLFGTLYCFMIPIVSYLQYAITIFIPKNFITKFYAFLNFFNFIFNINYYYSNYIKLLYYVDVHTGWQHFSTIVVWMNCSVCLAWLNRLASGSGWLRVPDLGLSGGHHKFRLKFRSTTESSWQVPLTFRLLFNSSTHLRRLLSLSPLPDGVI